MHTTKISSHLETDLLLLEQRKLQQQQGERFLQFSLKAEINGLVSLKDLQGTIELSLTDILPVPNVADFWLGISNWQGEAIWILDLAQLLGATNWYRRTPIITSGMAILIKIEQQTLGLLVEEVQEIKNYELQHCLPITEINLTTQMQAHGSDVGRSIFKGYFLNSRGEPSMVLDLNNLIYILQS
jgi:positive phototaxis protein PixI